MDADEAARIIQIAYPQVYLACHTRHPSKRSTEHELSQRDSTILVHVDASEPTAPSALARHLRVGRPTVSEALRRLIALGFLARARRGSAAVVLTKKGAQAIADTSVLETGRLRAVLSALSEPEREHVCSGLRVLAEACRTADLDATASIP